MKGISCPAKCGNKVNCASIVVPVKPPSPPPVLKVESNVPNKKHKVTSMGVISDKDKQTIKRLVVAVPAVPKYTTVYSHTSSPSLSPPAVPVYNAWKTEKSQQSQQLPLAIEVESAVAVAVLARERRVPPPRYLPPSNNAKAFVDPPAYLYEAEFNMLMNMLLGEPPMPSPVRCMSPTTQLVENMVDMVVGY
jgi:hypothetical protein